MAWSLIDGKSVRYEYGLPDGASADYVLCNWLDQADMDVVEMAQGAAPLAVDGAVAFVDRMNGIAAGQLGVFANEGLKRVDRDALFILEPATAAQHSSLTEQTLLEEYETVRIKACI